MRKALPLVVAALVLAAIAWRTLQQPGRDLAKARTLSLAHAGEVKAAREALAAYETRYRAPEDIWFASDILMRTGDVEAALGRVFDHPVLGKDRATPRRFAREALHLIGWEDGDFARPTIFVGRVLVTLLEAGDAHAEYDQGRRLSEQPIEMLLGYWFEHFRDCSGRPMLRGREFLRKRSERDAKAAAGLAAARPGPASATAGEVAALREIIDDPTWHERQPIAWHLACTAYAKAGGKAGMKKLHEMLQEIAPQAGTSPRAAIDEATLATALFGGGDQLLLDRLVHKYLLEADPKLSAFGAWVVEALLSRHREGDGMARKALAQLWDDLRPEGIEYRERIATALFLEGEPTDALPLSREAVVAALRGEGFNVRSRMLAAAIDLAAGERDALPKLVTALRELTGAKEEMVEARQAPLYMSALLTGLRALLLYGDAAGRA
ncbi:MAG: hypothetical protein H6806_05605 [Planctomycetes bacterium]|nr:hypothetical protein [Planctomycetota bacterium]MCB9826027.1 hypothetical protein [Planctomycetota bacterium]MCB9829217.1 hypothetical protein [Planctomycetota bacterium]